jgi:hypothetical protein
MMRRIVEGHLLGPPCKRDEQAGIHAVAMRQLYETLGAGARADYENRRAIVFRSERAAGLRFATVPHDWSTPRPLILV